MKSSQNPESLRGVLSPEKLVEEFAKYDSELKDWTVYVRDDNHWQKISIQERTSTIESLNELRNEFLYILTEANNPAEYEQMIAKNFPANLKESKAAVVLQVHNLIEEENRRRESNHAA